MMSTSECSTREEREWLEDGGDTFGVAKSGQVRA